MLSELPSIFPSEIPITGDPIESSFEDGLQSWDRFFEIFPKPVLSPNHVQSSPSGSDVSNNSDPISHGTTENTNPDDMVINERKRKRRVSNQESAKRSRMRKQKHLENLSAELNRLKVENQELADRVHVISNHARILLAENDKLLAEHAMLRLVLSDMQQMLLLRELQEAWPCNNQIIRPSMFEQIPAPLLTELI